MKLFLVLVFFPFFRLHAQVVGIQGVQEREKSALYRVMGASPEKSLSGQEAEKMVERLHL